MQEVEAGISDLGGICRHRPSTHGDRIRKANDHLELNLARDGKNIKKASTSLSSAERTSGKMWACC